MIKGRWCYIPKERSKGDNFYFPRNSSRKNATIVKKKHTHFFRHNYGNAANQSMFANKLGT